MQTRNILTRTLTLAGFVLVAFPLIAPLLLGVASLILSGVFRLDILIPGELGFFALAGAGMLLAAAWRLRLRRRLIGAGLAAALVGLLGSQAVAQLTGLASGETPPGGWQWALVLALFGVYLAALAAVAVGGALLLGRVFARR
ncbi:MAG: hypothetical protein HPY45_15645 [Anaerolineae bacterium]|nr:hypothetical protein [Anaerolineae bacterium]